MKSRNTPSAFVLVSVFCSLLALTSTGQAGEYTSMNPLGGANAVREPNDIFRIEYHHHFSMDGKKAEDFVLLKSAETALENGYIYFEVLGSTTPRTSFPPLTLGVTTRTWHTIKCFKRKLVDIGGLVYDARELSRDLRAKYGLGPREFSGETAPAAWASFEQSELASSGESAELASDGEEGEDLDAEPSEPFETFLPELAGEGAPTLTIKAPPAAAPPAAVPPAAEILAPAHNAVPPHDSSAIVPAADSVPAGTSSDPTPIQP